eukprot:320879-Hanusia_phi.AAC.1
MIGAARYDPPAPAGRTPADHGSPQRPGAAAAELGKPLSDDHSPPDTCRVCPRSLDTQCSGRNP